MQIGGVDEFHRVSLKALQGVMMNEASLSR
jgi:hypothetical protein